MVQFEHWNNRLKAVAFGLGLALTAVTVRHWYGTFFYGHPPCDNCRADFPGFYAAAKLIWQNPSALYDYPSQLAIQRAIDSRIGESILPFAYPPFTAVVLMPLGWLPFRAAFVGMTLVNAVLLLATLALLIRKLDLERDQNVWLLLIAFCNVGVHTVLLQGQTSLMMLLPLTAFMFSVLGGEQIRAGFWTGVTFFKPQFLAVPLVTLVFQRLWLALAIAIAVLGSLCITSVVLVGTEGISEYIRLLKLYGSTQSGFGSYPQDMHNLRALVQFLVPFSYAKYFWLALVIPVAVLTMWLNAGAGDSERITAFLWIGNFLAMLLISPHLYPHDLSLLIVPSAFALKLCRGRALSWISSLLVLTGILPILPLATGIQMPPVLPILFLLVFLGCVWFVRQSAKSLADSSERFD